MFLAGRVTVVHGGRGARVVVGNVVVVVVVVVVVLTGRGGGWSPQAGRSHR
jgi:hypothetical protein